MSEKRFSVRLRSECDGVIYSFFDGDKPLDVDMIVDKLNEQQDTIKNLYDEIHSLKKIIKEQTLRVYCQDQEIQKLINQLEKIPPKIRDVWL